MILRISNIANNIINRPNMPKFGLNRMSYPNLAPLPKDTVSFSGRSELVASSMADAPSSSDCKNVHKNAEPARYYLQKIFETYLKPITESSNNGRKSQNPVLTYTTRIKSPVSIREKVVSKYSKLYQKEQEEFSKKLLEQIMKKYKLNDGVQPEYVYRAFIQEFMYNSGASKSSPYANVPYSVNQAFDILDTMKHIDFSQHSSEENNAIKASIIDALTPTGDTHVLSNGKYMDPANVSGIKHYAKDIVGGRIILQKSGAHYNTAKVLDALKQASNDGMLKITSIECHIPDEKKLPHGKKLSDYEYASEKTLQKLANASGAKLIMNKSKTGYMAIHINIDLSNDDFKHYNGVFNGYSGEIQIIGRDVEQLKDIEDLCYKIKDKKNAFKAIYKPFRDYFLKYYTDEVKDAFEDYTYALYLSQRAIQSKNGNSSFESIEKLGFNGKVPKELDFNKLKQIKLACTNGPDNPDRIQTNGNDSTRVIKDGNIQTIKNVIDSKFDSIRCSS